MFHVEWVRPRVCYSFWAWLLYGWDFIGRGGRRVVGFRICGLEVERR
jgi:hypothetical protein